MFEKPSHNLIRAIIDVEDKAKALQWALVGLQNVNTGEIPKERIRLMIDAAYKNRDGETSGDGTLFWLADDFLGLKNGK